MSIFVFKILSLVRIYSYIIRIVHSLEQQLEYERVKREKLESQLDHLRVQVHNLKIQLADATDQLKLVCIFR